MPRKKEKTMAEIRAELTPKLSEAMNLCEKFLSKFKTDDISAIAQRNLKPILNVMSEIAGVVHQNCDHRSPEEREYEIFQAPLPFPLSYKSVRINQNGTLIRRHIQGPVLISAPRECTVLALCEEGISPAKVAEYIQSQAFNHLVNSTMTQPEASA
jgi:hypothetical protein